MNDKMLVITIAGIDDIKVECFESFIIFVA